MEQAVSLLTQLLGKGLLHWFIIQKFMFFKHLGRKSFAVLWIHLLC